MNKLKITGENEKVALQMVTQGHNATEIARAIGCTETTVTSWANRSGIQITKRLNPETLAKQRKFIELIQQGAVLAHALKEAGVEFRKGKELIVKNGLSHVLRSIKDAAIDRRLPLEEANSRLPAGDHGKVIAFDAGMKSYIVQRTDGSTYSRVSNQLFRGDPNYLANKKHSNNDLAQKLTSIGYKLAPNSEPSTRKPITAIHLACGNPRTTVIYQFFIQECPHCSNTGTSNQETELAEWVRSLGLTADKKRFPKETKGKGKGKEIDIFIPELNIGIEYCGLYFHGETVKNKTTEAKKFRHVKKGREYATTDYDSPKLAHKVKLEKCKSHGIELLTIFSNEWNFRKSQIKGFIRAKLGKNERHLYGRKCTVQELGKDAARNFFNLYHIQGSSRIDVAFGLFHGDELVGAVSGSRHHRQRQEFVLNRLCFKESVSVVGGSSKLQKQLAIWAKTSGYSAIKTWSDNRFSQGKVYQALGYELISILPPDYLYFDNKGNVYSKQSCQKKHLTKRGAQGNTEYEMAKSLGLDRIWDCGKKAWIKYL